ncbi:MAG: hypothetical protein HN929_10410 [Chloroflexi bacterium]|jgi:hypothetical protein|nr:hypothetical protein [Chloroflexota bacterium]MBT7081862.1 hypothetical protein [Chloroflexota bacterium]MBT7289457.1 hypothetical protein [Chloroflexota bacterium]
MFLLGIFGSVSLLVAIVVGFAAFAAVHYVPILSLILAGMITARMASGFLRGIIAGVIVGLIVAAVITILPEIDGFDPVVLEWGAASGVESTWIQERLFSYALLGGIGGLLAGIRKKI